MLEKLESFFRNWSAPLLWAAFIFFLSSQPNLRSGLPAFWDIFFRKLGHIFEYFVLFLLLFGAFRKKNFSKGRSAFWAVFIAVTYAFSDEFHQRFVLGRHASLLDVGVDSIGIFFALYLKL